MTRWIELERCGALAQEPELLALPFAALSWSLTVASPLSPLEFPGGPLRGALGPRLKQLACTRAGCGESGAACLVPTGCAFGALYNKGSPRREDQAARPALLALRATPWREVAPGSAVHAQAVLFGDGVAHTHVLGRALAAPTPLDVQGGTLLTAGVSAPGRGGAAWSPSASAPPPVERLGALPVPLVSRLRLRFVSPVALTRERTLVTEASPRLLAAALASRLDKLAVPLGRAWGRAVETWLDCSWRDEGFQPTRLPRRPGGPDRRPYELAGITGAMTVDTTERPEACAVAALIALLGVGKSVSLGFGAPSLEQVG